MLVSQIKTAAVNAFQQLFPDAAVKEEQILVNETKPEFEGDYTIVLFPFVKQLRQSPDQLAEVLGNTLVANNNFIISWQSIKGFLNLTITDAWWQQFNQEMFQHQNIALTSAAPQRVMVEYSSPNTNKPLHFGHLRNIFLGWSVAEILKNVGNNVIKANLINDRGIHICKSMIAWMRYANGATPLSTGIKGDHLVGDYYVKFNDIFKQEVGDLVAKGIAQEQAEKEAPILIAAQELLIKWEQGDAEVIELWKTMNGWVYEGFDVTYDKMGIDFERRYYESDTYLLGKELVESGLEKGVLYKKENGSVWIDLTEDGLDEKLLLRADGTSVYMTQDLGTAKLKHDDYNLDKSIYVIGDEQNYHMQVLKLILEKLSEPCASTIYHLSYGMVELPSGKMKSREGTVVDADDMINEMIDLARQQTEAAGKTKDFSTEELEQLYRTIGIGALKFYLLRVEPKKKMIFNPAESIDLHGFTAAFIQYAHARICSILRKNEGWETGLDEGTKVETLAPLEKALMLLLEQFESVVHQAAVEYNPSLICNYSFKLAQTFNSFYDKHSISNAESEMHKVLRLKLASNTAKTIKFAMSLLGISVPDRM